MLSKEQWRHAEEIAAAHKRGERRERYHTFRRWYAVPTSIAAALGAIGFGCWWIVKRVASAVAGIDTPSVGPGGAYWLFVGAALVLTVIAYMAISPATFLVAAARAVAVAATWLLLIGYGLSAMI